MQLKYNNAISADGFVNPAFGASPNSVDYGER
jgi:hypothetical protein